MDVISEARLSQVSPQLATLVRQMADQLASENIFIRITQGLRTIAQQDALYAQGRIEPGRIITDARGLDSWHCLGCAVDVAPFDEGIPDWDEKHPAWGRIVEVGVNLGLVSGISWKDEPHFELTGRFPAKPTQEVKDLYTAGGVQSVWNAVNSEQS